MHCWSISFSGSISQLFRKQIGIHVLHQFNAFHLKYHTNIAGVQTYVENSFVTLAPPNAFIATTVACLRQNKTDMVGGRC